MQSSEETEFGALISRPSLRPNEKQTEIGTAPAEAPVEQPDAALDQASAVSTSQPADVKPWPLLLRTMRPKQWTKNVFVFAALIFARDLDEPRKVALTVAAFVLFCALSSAVYIMNDLADREKDRMHPTKRNRPLASGALSPNIAITALVVILVIVIPLTFLINIPFGLISVLYFVSQVAYSFWLKNVVIVDVFVLASGFVIRAVAGALAIQVIISPWLFVCMSLLALFLGLSKRRHELLLLNAGAGSHRKILEEYSPLLLEQMIGVVTASTVMAYSLYTFSAENLPRSHIMMATIPFVLYAIFRYLYLIYQKNEGGSPEELLLRDRPLLIGIALWGLTSVALLYVAPLFGW